MAAMTSSSPAASTTARRLSCSACRNSIRPRGSGSCRRCRFRREATMKSKLFREFGLTSPTGRGRRAAPGEGLRSSEGPYPLTPTLSPWERGRTVLAATLVKQVFGREERDEAVQSFGLGGEPSRTHSVPGDCARRRRLRLLSGAGPRGRSLLHRQGGERLGDLARRDGGGNADPGRRSHREEIAGTALFRKGADLFEAGVHGDAGHVPGFDA